MREKQGSFSNCIDTDKTNVSIQSPVRGGQLSDMERERYQNQIKELVRGMQTLLDANKAMGERMAHLEKIAKDYEDLKAENAKLKGELAMRKRGQHDP
jgi:cell shape-determining protein MreC